MGHLHKRETRCSLYETALFKIYTFVHNSSMNKCKNCFYDPLLCDQKNSRSVNMHHLTLCMLWNMQTLLIYKAIFQSSNALCFCDSKTNVFPPLWIGFASYKPFNMPRCSVCTYLIIFCPSQTLQQSKKTNIVSNLICSAPDYW